MNTRELIEKINKIAIDTPFQNSKIVDHLEVIKLIEQLDEPQKVKVPQFVADWYEENKDCFEANLYRFVCNLTSIFDGAKINEFERWFLTAGTKPFQTIVNMHQFGYEVEKEKRYTIRFKNIRKETRYLKYDRVVENWYFGVEQCSKETKISHTRTELEEAGFGWVFDCPGIEVEEATE